MAKTVSIRCDGARRRGVSLLEVVIALGIFLGAYAVITGILHLGSRAATDALTQNQATLRAENVLNEILAGVQPFASSGPNFFEDDDRWSWSSEVGDGPHVDLKQVSVTVSYTEGNATTSSLTISRYARDPELYLDAASGSTL